jgi:Mg-chelatase subunit ChlD
MTEATAIKWSPSGGSTTLSLGQSAGNGDEKQKPVSIVITDGICEAPLNAKGLFTLKVGILRKYPAISDGYRKCIKRWS